MIENCVDLLYFRQYEQFLVELMAAPKGRWIAMSALPYSTEVLADNSQVYVVWLDSAEDEGRFAFILFYDAKNFETTKVIFNRTGFLERNTATGLLH